MPVAVSQKTAGSRCPTAGVLLPPPQSPLRATACSTSLSSVAERSTTALRSQGRMDRFFAGTLRGLSTGLRSALEDAGLTDASTLANYPRASLSELHMMGYGVSLVHDSSDAPVPFTDVAGTGIPYYYSWYFSSHSLSTYLSRSPLFCWSLFLVLSSSYLSCCSFAFQVRDLRATETCWWHLSQRNNQTRGDSKRHRVKRKRGAEEYRRQ